MADIPSTLGLGSKGALSIDRIKASKEKERFDKVVPYDKQIELNTSRQESEKLLTSYMKDFQSNSSSLSYDTLFDGIDVYNSGTSLVEVSDGASVESFTLKTIDLAKKDIVQFGYIKSKDTKVGNDDGTLEIKIGEDSSNPDKTIDIDYTKDMTLRELSQAITDQAGSDISVSILQTSDDKFNIILTSKETGAAQKLTITDKDSNLNADLFDSGKGYKTVQDAQDSKFEYNDIEITRDTNKISDLILGVDITLLKEGDTSVVEIVKDDLSIVSEVEKFVQSYNTLKLNINDMTAYNKEAKTKGVFQGDNFVRGISKGITDIVTSRGSGNSLIDYGISINRDGSMSLDKSVLEKQLSDNRQDVKEFFTGGTFRNGDEKEGIFERINTKVKSYTGYNKLLSDFESSLKRKGENLAEMMKKAQESLDNKYDIMTKRFVSYDSMIGRTNSSFSALEMQIKMLVASK